MLKVGILCIWTWGWIHAYLCVFVCLRRGATRLPLSSTRLHTHPRTYSLQRLQRSVRQPAQRLGHDLVLGLAGGNGAPPGAVGVGVCHWRHGRVGCQASAATSAGLGSSGTCRGGGNKQRRAAVYLAVYLVCICFQDKNTQIHAYPHPSPSVFNI